MKLTLVKTFLVLNLILFTAVAVVSYMVFKDREVIKASTILSLEAVRDTANNLQWGGVVNWESDTDRKNEAFSISLPVEKDGLAAFETRLGELEEYAAYRLEQLDEEYNDLQASRQELSETEEMLSIRTQERDEARNRATQLKEDLSALEERLNQTKGTIADLERKKRTLDRQVEDLESEVASKEEQIAYLEKRLNLRTQERDQIQALYEACEGRGRVGGGSGPENLGMPGKVLAIDPKWNFVVVNRGEVDVLPMFSEALVHRGDAYVGKLRVRQVERGVAVAEILPETFAEGMSVQIGDTLFFNN